MQIKTTSRHNILFQILLPSLTIFILAGCQKVINVDLNEAAPLIVIEGLITDSPGPYTVTISKSGSYFNQPVLPPVSGAQVFITDNIGTIDTLKEVNPGIYRTIRTKGIPGRTYTIKVLSESSEYTGTSTMFNHVPIDSLHLLKSQQRFGFGNPNESRFELHCFFKDPMEKNFYRIKVITNDSTNAENIRLYDDQYTNGEETDLRVARPKAGDRCKIELLSLDKLTYGYYRTLEDLIRTNPFFGSTPANPNTNLSNGALGYFGASAVSFKTVIITDSLINTAR